MANTLQLPRGPMVVDVAGFTLTELERERLSHPLVGGVILFRRNFESIEQLKALTTEIHALRSPHLLIAVDHEGGRVQRFLPGFTRLPPMQVLGTAWEENPVQAQSLAETVGEVLAAELRACGIDLSFTPVLDLDWSRCAVIGNRSFHRDPAVVSALAAALIHGLKRGGMAACGKHFPGHGWVEGDSHHVIPEDERSLEEIRAGDLVPFAQLAEAGLASVMPAHVIYPKVNSQPAGFSSFWLQTVLRGELKYDGVIFSDDLCMEGAAGAGNIVDRVNAAFAAGCDMALICNRPDLADEVLKNLQVPEAPKLAERLERMAGSGDTVSWQAYVASTAFAQLQAKVARLSVLPDALTGPAVGEAH